LRLRHRFFYNTIGNASNAIHAMVAARTEKIGKKASFQFALFQKHDSH
jgi:hypothetical protein